MVITQKGEAVTNMYNIGLIVNKNSCLMNPTMNFARTSTARFAQNMRVFVYLKR